MNIQRVIVKVNAGEYLFQPQTLVLGDNHQHQSEAKAVVCILVNIDNNNLLVNL